MANIVVSAKLLMLKVQAASAATFASVALLMLMANPVYAAQALVPQPPQLAASAYILIDAITGKVIV